MSGCPFPAHPAAGLFPMLAAADLSSLVDDIKVHGLREPIVTYKGHLLDGRNRLLACEIAGVEPRTEAYTGNDPVAYVVSLNLRRRHLDESQRAMVAARLANLPRGGDRSRPPNGGLPTSRAADLLNVGARTVERARAVLRDGAPELVAAVEQGRVAVSTAAAVAGLTLDQQRAIINSADPRVVVEAAKAIRARAVEVSQARRLDLAAALAAGAQPLPSGKTYALILADPPWSYDNDYPASGRNARDHYPCMGLEEIVALKIPAATSAILFLWATSPMLPKALQVMSAWGFDYRSSVIWDKCLMGMGSWVRVQHELILIGVKGDFPTPAPANRPPSVIRAARREHSRKPDEAYDLIERMYPGLPRIEMFARAARVGWDRWGNQAPVGEAGDDAAGAEATP